MGAVVQTDAINVVFTTTDDTLEAVRVASELGRAMGAELKVVHFRSVPVPLSLEHPAGVSPIETDAFIRLVRAEGMDARVRVFLCRSAESAIPMAFRRDAMIVVGGRRRHWWPTAAERLRRQLEAAGCFVVFVDTGEHRESSRA